MGDIKNYVCDKAQRLDTFLSAQIGQTRSQIAILIKQNCVEVENKKVARAGMKLKVAHVSKLSFQMLRKRKLSMLTLMLRYFMKMMMSWL